MIQQPSVQTGFTSLPRVEIRPLLRNVFGWMTGGLLVTTLVAFATVTFQPLLNLAVNPFVMFGALIGELILVIVLGRAINRLSTLAASLMFFVYAALNGFTLSLIFLVYNLGTIGLAFASTTLLFGVMAIVGAFTKADLTKWGTYLFIGLLGIMGAMILNIFLRSSGLDFIISIAGVVLFTALTAYDVNQITKMASDPRLVAEEGSLMTKLSIIGALKLYLDFINLFLFLLRIFGRRR